VCGATVFWWNAGRPGVLDLSVGLVDETQNGVRAEDFLDWWTDRVSFCESGVSPQLAQGLAEGLAASKDL